MLQQLINHSPDLKRLQNEGYELEVKGGYLLIHHIPYVNHSREVKYGILVSELSLANSQKTIKPSTHVINFIGEYPYRWPIHHRKNAPAASRDGRGCMAESLDGKS